MNRIAKTACASFAAVLVGLSAAHAQFTPPDFSGLLATNQQLAAGACLAGRCGSPAPSQNHAGSKVHPSTSLAGMIGRPASVGAHQIPLVYAPSGAVHQRVVADLVDRVRVKDPQGAQGLKAAFAKYDYDRLYDGIAGSYGLAGNDAGNAMAAYLILGWLIANGQQDVPGGRATALAVRAQVGKALAENGAASQGHVAELGEELKLQFIVAHAGWLRSMRERSGQPYADSIAGQFLRIYGIDLRHTSLCASGFRTKG